MCGGLVAKGQFAGSAGMGRSLGVVKVSIRYGAVQFSAGFFVQRMSHIRSLNLTLLLPGFLGHCHIVALGTGNKLDAMNGKLIVQNHIEDRLDLAGVV